MEMARVSYESHKTEFCFLVFSLFFAVLGLELRAYNLSHSTSPFL
jgi:hypothetical protein